MRGRTASGEVLVVAKIAPLARRQRPEHHLADANALEPRHLQADRLAHPADLSLHAFAQDEAKLIGVDRLDLGGPENALVERQAVPQALEVTRAQRAAAEAHQVFLVDRAGV